MDQSGESGIRNTRIHKGVKGVKGVKGKAEQASIEFGHFEFYIIGEKNHKKCLDFFLSYTYIPDSEG